MTIYRGVDFHARQQTVAYCDAADGGLHLRELEHARNEVRGFYSPLTGEAVVGIEASGYSTWFVELVEGLKRFYLRLLRRRGAQRAKFAVARELLIRGYLLLRDGIGYAEFLRRGVEARPARLET